MHTPCNNAAYLAELCAGAEAIEQAKEESYLFATCVAVIFIAGSAALFLYWQNQEPVSLPLRKDRKAA